MKTGKKNQTQNPTTNNKTLVKIDREDNKQYLGGGAKSSADLKQFNVIKKQLF